MLPCGLSNKINVVRTARLAISLRASMPEERRNGLTDATRSQAPHFLLGPRLRITDSLPAGQMPIFLVGGLVDFIPSINAA